MKVSVPELCRVSRTRAVTGTLRSGKIQKPSGELRVAPEGARLQSKPSAAADVSLRHVHLVSLKHAGPPGVGLHVFAS
jgi:hypothetical protein